MSELCASLREKTKTKNQKNKRENSQRIRRIKGGYGDMDGMSKKEWLALLNTAERG